MRPKVKAGGKYPMDDGHIVVDSIDPIELDDVTEELARESGFPNVDALLAMARHGKGENVYLVRFHYVPPARGAADGKAERMRDRAPARSGITRPRRR